MDKYVVYKWYRIDEGLRYRLGIFFRFDKPSGCYVIQDIDPVSGYSSLHYVDERLCRTICEKALFELRLRGLTQWSRDTAGVPKGLIF